MAILYKRAFNKKWLGQPATAQNVIPAAAGLAPTTPARLFSLRMLNRGALMAMAVVALLKDSAWEAGQWVAVGTTLTLDTVDAQDAGTNDFALETVTVNDGFIIGADVPFGAISLDVTTAGIGNTTHVIEYWNGAWTAIAATGLFVDIKRSAVWALGEELVLFDPPADWIVGGSGTNVSATRYNIRITCTTVAAGTAALARRIYVGAVLASESALASEGSAERESFPEWVNFNTTNHAAIGLAAATLDELHALEIVYQP